MSVIDIEDAHSLRVNFDQDTPLRKGTKMVTRQNWSLQAVKKYQPRAHAAHLIIPTDAMLIMLSFLPARLVMESVQLVSKQWFCTAMDNTLWRELFRFGISKLTSSVGKAHVNKISENFSGRHFFLLYKSYIAAQQEPIHVHDMTHIRWAFRCPLSWFDLQPTKDSKTRACTACHTQVKQLSVSQFQSASSYPCTAVLVSDGRHIGATYAKWPDVYAPMGIPEEFPLPDDSPPFKKKGKCSVM
eukprot:TRINITY_DN67904_c5_g2_i3.p1 TRINITY_DN67904_c5_g2~~TRINITY_DN67904_c5_g2_i3.p1  ORF type:complete len:243 (-),score=23.54 TRINITY_DN67904_c5_g2_i3:500-1228(-)